MDTTISQALSDVFAPLEDYRISHPKAIGNVLKQLMSRKEFLTVACNHRPHQIVTRILDVNMEAGFFIYDGSAEPVYNRSLLESDANYFSATQDGVQIQFVGGQPEQHMFEGCFAFRSPIPESLYRMQRRDFFRVETSLKNPYRCIAKLPDRRQITLDIFDLSLGGVGLRSRDIALEVLPIGTLLSQAVLDCRNMGTTQTDLKITYLQNIKNPGSALYHVGCRFENYPKSRATELQRMITSLELARKSRSI
ncbi:flagellar brake protein [Rhodoferax sp.]|uniref:flagellar brake protein n=1 Tax=Rhodoferax sp. TaxID=50421 RepID=UPI002734F836|nr:flagellar brake protein [Rhodoferax sp.]MDP3191971.1 flagellar brake protein [Rhodoferax sp.]MDP3337733.1 flagellar brake protein [Rhodoferax sp.]